MRFDYAEGITVLVFMALMLLVFNMALQYFLQVSMGTPNIPFHGISSGQLQQGASVIAVFNVSRDIVPQLNLELLMKNDTLVASTAMNAATTNSSQLINYTFPELQAYTDYKVRAYGSAAPNCNAMQVCPQYIIEINETENVTTGAVGSSAEVGFRIP